MIGFHYITLFPQFVESYQTFGVFGSARQKGLAAFTFHQLRDFAVDKHGTVDGRPFGGGDGMVLRCEPLADVIKSIHPKPYVILPTPAGKLWHQREAKPLLERACGRPLAFVCGRFAGVDQRFIDLYVDEEFSLGDYVISGGELAALVMSDSILRIVPGVLGNEQSAIDDSFSEGCSSGLEHPLFTRPLNFEGHEVPGVLVSGDHKAIELWRKEESQKRTQQRRGDLTIFK